MLYPANGGTIFLDGRYASVSNYSFFNEYIGPNDHVVCGNRSITQSVSAFQESVTQSISQAVVDAPINNGYSWARVALPGTRNRSVYVLANCWRTLNATTCSRCLQNASASISRCLPRSEGRALNTGCFLRYSDRFFLNYPAPAENGGKHSRRKCYIMVVMLFYTP